jgi:hypothetical protein
VPISHQNSHLPHLLQKYRLSCVTSNVLGIYVNVYDI